MEEVFSIEFRGDHVEVRIGENAPVDDDLQEEYWKRLQAACREYDTCRVLVEGFSPKGERDTSEVVEAGQRTATIPHLWIAYCLEGWEPTEQSELYEAIATSRGVRVKFFSDREQALEWLRNNSPK